MARGRVRGGPGFGTIVCSLEVSGLGAGACAVWSVFACSFSRNLVASREQIDELQGPAESASREVAYGEARGLGSLCDVCSAVRSIEVRCAARACVRACVRACRAKSQENAP